MENPNKDTYIQVGVGHLDLAAHRRRLAVVNAVGVAVLHVHLGAVAFPEI